MIRLLTLAGLAWLACRVFQENAHREPAALIPSPGRMRRQIAAAKLRSAAEGR